MPWKNETIRVGSGRSTTAWLYRVDDQRRAGVRQTAGPALLTMMRYACNRQFDVHWADWALKKGRSRISARPRVAGAFGYEPYALGRTLMDSDPIDGEAPEAVWAAVRNLPNSWRRWRLASGAEAVKHGLATCSQRSPALVNVRWRESRLMHYAVCVGRDQDGLMIYLDPLYGLLTCLHWDESTPESMPYLARSFGRSYRRLPEIGFIEHAIFC